ncbi:hypothetical protein [Natrarchaeobaculum sulfurireducens]|uniref:Uncharacterized protein n=1 Tax=Natrarchaeobaculum sulfurireducens TaxID=2044521 RepID=A0A346P9G3_9EURY|nr:hypothetical protein [Natrarchaeobaculum sulfurireducens]AXR76158.1 hypothetical protein AArc1_4041 [Natrarchaeobaculum sulfurireducens]
MREKLTEKLHQPEYTGENRCEACTVVNIIIAGVIGAIISRKSKLAGIASIGVSLLLIYLRGYLIPGTPTLTKRYMPASVLQLFGKDSEPKIRNGLTTSDNSSLETSNTSSTTPSTTNNDTQDDSDTMKMPTESPEEYFISMGAVEECENKDDLCIAEAFESEWVEEISDLSNGDFTAEDVAAALDLNIENDEFTIQEDDQTRRLKRDKRVVGQWPSEAALIADVASSRILRSRDEDWDKYKPDKKGELLNGLRLFLDTYPTTEGEIVLSEETVESCCSTHEVIVAVCEDTDERIFEHPMP